MEQARELLRRYFGYKAFRPAQEPIIRDLLAGRDRCRHLVVGITNPDPTHTRAESADAKRSDPAANPLTYFERQAMVRAALTAAGFRPEVV